MDLSESLNGDQLQPVPGERVRVQNGDVQDGKGPREGNIAELSKLWGKTYAYTFDFASVRAPGPGPQLAVHHHLTDR